MPKHTETSGDSKKLADSDKVTSKIRFKTCGTKWKQTWKNYGSIRTLSSSGHLSVMDGHAKRKLWRKIYQEANSKLKITEGLYSRVYAQHAPSESFMCSEHFWAEGQQDEDFSPKSTCSFCKHVVHSHDRKRSLWSSETKVECFDLNS